MEVYIFGALGIIAIMALFVLALKLFVFLFCNLFTSTLLCAGCCIASIVMGVKLMPAVVHDAPLGPLLIANIIVSVFAWLFLIGYQVFEYQYDGVDINRDSDGNLKSITPRRTGGFIWNFIIATLLISFLYIGLGSEMPEFYFVVPIGTLILLCVFKVRYIVRYFRGE